MRIFLDTISSYMEFFGDRGGVAKTQAESPGETDDADELCGDPRRWRRLTKIFL